MTNIDLKQALAPIHAFQPLFHFVSHTTLFGFLPLDIVAHIFVGFVITKVMLHFRFKFWQIFLFLFIVEGIKEFYDSYTLTNTLTENVKDYIMTFVYPVWRWLRLQWLKKHAIQNQESSR